MKQVDSPQDFLVVGLVDGQVKLSQANHEGGPRYNTVLIPLADWLGVCDSVTKLLEMEANTALDDYMDSEVTDGPQ